jgi:hypothetical protein
MQFQINGQEYFLGYADEDHRWYVIQPTPRGMHRIPVYIDAPMTERAITLEGGTQTSHS